MILDDIRALYTRYQRQIALYPDAQVEDLGQVIRAVFPLEEAGVVCYSDLDSASADTVIQAQIAYFEKLGYGFEWKYYDYDTPPDLPERLLKAGFKAEDKEAILVLDMAQAPESLLAPIQHDIRRVTTVEGLRDADKVHQIVWEDEADAVSQRFTPVIEKYPESMSMYVAYVDNLPVSYGRVEFPSGENPFASIWGGSTLPDYRKRGIYSALVAARLQEARARGRHYLTVDADPNTSMPILHKLSFQTIAYSTPYLWEG